MFANMDMGSHELISDWTTEERTARMLLGNGKKSR
jgi:hypothetical protein